MQSDFGKKRKHRLWPNLTAGARLVSRQRSRAPSLEPLAAGPEPQIVLSNTEFPHLQSNGCPRRLPWDQIPDENSPESEVSRSRFASVTQSTCTSSLIS